MHKANVIIAAVVVLIVAAIVYLGVDFELHRATRGAVSQCVMPDGTVLQLQKVTFGKQHEFDYGLPSSGFSLLSRLSPHSFTTGTAEDSFVFWLTRHAASTGKSLDFDWWSHCVAFDDDGCEIVDQYPGRFAATANSSMSHSITRPMPPLSAQDSQKYDLVAVHSSMRAFRHRGNTFKLQVFDVKGTMAAAFEVPDLSPNRGQFSIWSPEALPVTKTDHGVSVTLKGFTGTKTASNLASGQESETIRMDAELEIEQDGQPAPQWSRTNVKILDAIGNVGSLWDCRLCPGEAAWKVQVRVFRSENAQFLPSELWTVPNVAAPITDKSTRLGEAQTLQGLTLELIGIGGAGTVTHYGLTQKTSGSWGMSGNIGAGATQFPFSLETKSEKGAGSTTTVKCNLPHIVARVKGLTEDHYTPDLQVADDQGRVVPAYGLQRHAEEIQFWFLMVPDDAKSLDLTFIVQKGRKVEFLVKPPPLGPLKGIRMAPAPTNVGQ